MVTVTVLGSGSAGNATAIQCGRSVLLIDAGLSAVEIARRMEEAGINVADVMAILISHEHDDHIQGARIFAKRHGDIPTYSNSLTAERLRYMKKAPEKLTIFANGSPFTVGPFQIEAFSVCHDAVDPVGFVIHSGTQRVGIATDLGYIGKLVPRKLYDCWTLILESNHDPEMLRNSQRPAQLQHRIRSRRGHLSNQDAAELVSAVVGPATKHLIMAHLSDECNDPELVRGVIAGQLRTLKREDVTLWIARQDKACATISL